MQAALSALGEAPAPKAASSVAGPSAPSAAPVQTAAELAAATKLLAEQRDYCVRAIEDIKGTVLEVAAMRYGAFIDPTSPKIQKLGKLSILGKKSVERNAARLAPRLEKLVDGPWALGALIGLETLAMWVSLKREATKAGWVPPKREPKAAAPAHQANGKPAAAPAPKAERFDTSPLISEPFPRAVMQ